MFDRHQAEITVMQFTGHSLPVHQSMSVPWDFLPCPISLAKHAYAISTHNCHWNVSLPSGASPWNGKIGQIEGQNTTFTTNTNNTFRKKMIKPSLLQTQTDFRKPPKQRRIEKHKLQGFLSTDTITDFT